MTDSPWGFETDFYKGESLYIHRNRESGCKSRYCYLDTINLTNPVSVFWAGYLFVKHSQCVPCWIRLMKKARKLFP
jgi:hypothetical protein